MERLGRGIAWLDTDTFDALLQASNFVQSIEERQGLMVACVEEISYRSGWIDANQLCALGGRMSGTKYGAYLVQLSRQSPGEAGVAEGHASGVQS